MQSVENLVKSWERGFNYQGDKGPDPLLADTKAILTQLATRAQLVGLCARTDPALLQGEAWDGLLESGYAVVGDEDARDELATYLILPLLKKVESCSSRFDALAKEHQSTGTLPRLSEPDSVIQLVDDVDALAQLWVGVSWVVDRGQPIEAQGARIAMKHAQALLERIGRRADCLAAAQERLEALRSTIDESVLSSDPRMSIQQHQAIGELSAFAATVRRSAVWIAQAKARVFWALSYHE